MRDRSLRRTSNKSYNVKIVTKVESAGATLNSSTEPHCRHRVGAAPVGTIWFVWIDRRRYHRHRAADFPPFKFKLNPD
jgi:hypothetical protein